MRQCKVTYTFSFEARDDEDKPSIVANAMREAATLIADGGKLSDDVFGYQEIGRVAVSYEASIKDAP